MGRNDLIEDFALEEIASEWFNEFYKKYFKATKILDVTKKEEYQKIGIDKILTVGNGEEIKVEEKVRSWRNRDFFKKDILFEYWHSKRNWLGWVYTTQAKYYVYGLSNENKNGFGDSVRVVDLQPDGNSNSFKIFIRGNNWQTSNTETIKNGVKLYRTKNFIVPIEDLGDWVTIV
jgi:hypothetical protein